MILALYLVVLVAWAAVGLYALPAALSFAWGDRRFGDKARLMVVGWAGLFVGFMARRIAVSREADPALVALLVASLVIAFLTWRTAKNYGRGWRV